MEEKAFVFMECDGEYDDYSEWVSDVLLGPENANAVVLRAEYDKFAIEEFAKMKEERKGLTGKEKRQFNLAAMNKRIQPYPDWLIEKKGFRRIKFEV